eukprot:scaffold335_cov253-Pinguiococcus_pyrenoidosus.AAC.3
MIQGFFQVSSLGASADFLTDATYARCAPARRVLVTTAFIEKKEKMIGRKMETPVRRADVWLVVTLRGSS